jgi:putative protease
MAITCPRCGAGFDVTLFQFGHIVRCDCGARVELAQGHVQTRRGSEKERAQMAEIEIGKVTHYFSKIGVAAIAITHDSLKVGDTIHVKGHTSDFQQKVDSMQIDAVAVEVATPGQSVGMKLTAHAREHDQVFKVVE